MELTSFLGEDECHLKIYFCCRAELKLRGWFWLIVAALLGCYYKPETKTCHNGSADLVVAKSETQLNCTVSSRNYIAKLLCEAVEDRSKRQLPTTITPEGSDVRKKRLESDGEQLKKKSPGKDNSRQTLFSESSTVRDSSNAESEIDWNIDTDASLTLAGQDADILTNYC